MMTNPEQQPPSLLLRVNNSNQLESGCEASHGFGPEGGRVGSSSQCDWRIQDSAGGVANEQFTVLWRDGAFCLCAEEKGLQINRAPLDKTRSQVRLQQGDEISAGKLTLSVFVSLDGGEIRDPLRVTPESLVTHYSNPLESLLEQPGRHERVDIARPIQEQTVAHSWSTDPLHVLQNESLTQPEASSGAATGLLADSPHGASAARALSDNVREYAMDQEYIELPHVGTRRASRDADRDDMAQHFVAVTPLMRGLDAPLAMHDSQQANDFLEEIGRTLRATINGLLALQRQQDALSDKHLRPLEDNPLRLSMDYDTTLNVLFADGKSPVHLSAPEAVAESLHNMQLHYQANQTAIAEALAVMLEAFSPPRLMARFAQYRRSAERGDMNADWAWNMYCSYYQELASSRQQGFEKLFNEVYAQAYDRALRQGQREREK